MTVKAVYWIRLLGIFSRLINVVIFNGHPSESLSGRCWRMRLQDRENRWWWRLTRVINWVFFWQSNHCRRAYLNDVAYSAQKLFHSDSLS